MLTLPKTLETFSGIIIERQEVRTLLNLEILGRNDPTKVNNKDKLREKVGQSSNNSMGPQCFGCQGYGHMKSECPTYLKSKGKAIAVTLSDGEISDDESECDEDGNFIAFTATAVVNESISAEENPSDEELSEEITYLAKNFRNFLRNNNRKARGANTAEPRNFRKNDPTKLNLEKK